MNTLTILAHKSLESQAQLEARKNFSAKPTKQQGFTLIELMIVVAIIDILAAVAIPAYTDYIKRGKVSEAVQLTGGLKTPVEEYYASTGGFPSDITALTDKTSGKYVENLAIASGDGWKCKIWFYVPGVGLIYIEVEFCTTVSFKPEDAVLQPYKYAIGFKVDEERWYCGGA